VIAEIAADFLIGLTVAAAALVALNPFWHESPVRRPR